MLACRLKTLNKLDKVEGKERQQREEEHTAIAAAIVSNKVSALRLEQSKVDPFAGLDIPLLPPRV
jgi:hypothetical protein